jgi:hypothetical protein
MTLLQALLNSNGTMAQFDHRELVFRPGNSLTKSREFLKDGVSGSGPHERA